MHKTVVNVVTGEQSIVPLTQEELDAIAAQPPAPPPVYKCNAWQIRKLLNAQGLRKSVEAVIANSDDQNLKDGWEFATEFHSDDPFVISMGAALGYTAEQTAQMVQVASTL